MRATTTLLDNNKVMLTVEIDDTEMDEAMDSAAKVLSKQVSVKGFRKGKVPKNVLIANTGARSRGAPRRSASRCPISTPVPSPIRSSIRSASRRSTSPPAKKRGS